MTHSAEIHNRYTAAGVTLVVCALVILLLIFSKLRYSNTVDRVWPPIDSSELLFAGEYVKFGEIPLPDRAASAQVADAMASDAMEMTNAGVASTPSPLVSSGQESPMKVSPKPVPERPGPTQEELLAQEKARMEREIAAKTASKVAGAFSSTKGSGSSTAESGSPQGNASDGALDGAPGTSLGGRTLQHWEKPSASAIGTIVIRVRVDRDGKVLSAEYERGTGAVAGSTAARNSCIAAARRSRFSTSTDAPAEQSGTITYRFK